MIAKTKATGTGKLDPDVLEYTSSLALDLHLLEADVAGSLAHLAMLVKVGLVAAEDAIAIRGELAHIVSESREGRLSLPEEEDVHMAIEARLTEKLGDRAGLLHTARSRNDQIALDLRLFVRDACLALLGELATTLDLLAKWAERDREIILPSYTHRQRAMAITGGFFWASYGAMLARDADLFDWAFYRVNAMPLGVGAIAGTSLPIDREHVKKSLEFGELTLNAMDTVADRDFEIDFVYACSRTMSHLGKIASDMIDLASSESRFIVLGDSIACGSSMMPQKKNPDLFEILRGKGARTQASLVSLAMLTSKLPSGYGRDLQESRQALFEAKNTVFDALFILYRGLDKVSFDRARCLAAVDEDYMQATDLAEALVVRHKVPFRTAYGLVGSLVKLAQDAKLPLGKVTLAQAQSIDFRFDAQVMVAIDPRKSPARKTSAGGTAPERVDEQIEKIRDLARIARVSANEVPRLDVLLDNLLREKYG